MNQQQFNQTLDQAVEQADLYFWESGMGYEYACTEAYQEKCQLEFEAKHNVSLLEWN